MVQGQLDLSVLWSAVDRRGRIPATDLSPVPGLAGLRVLQLDPALIDRGPAGLRQLASA